MKTTTLFAALDVLTGKVIASSQPRHRHGEFLNGLERLEANTPKRMQVHLVLDNYGTHKHPKVKAGSMPIHAITCTTRPRARPGST
jgi:putative transposase